MRKNNFLRASLGRKLSAMHLEEKLRVEAGIHVFLRGGQVSIKSGKNGSDNTSIQSKHAVLLTTKSTLQCTHQSDGFNVGFFLDFLHFGF